MASLLPKQGLYTNTVAPASPVPEELTERDQWVCWKSGKKRPDGKRTKEPVGHATGRSIDWTNPDRWVSFETALAAADEHAHDGAGYVFSEDDPFCGVDLDDCVDPDTGELHSAALDVLDQLDTYAEVSPSRTGIKAWVKATKPGVRCRTHKTPWGGKFEMYDRNQFFTVTEDVIRDAPVREAQSAVDALYGRFLAQPQPAWGEGHRRANRSVSGRATDLADGDLLEKARNNPKTGGMFRKLHDHDDASGYPSRSEADLAFCGMLAYWTRCDAEQMKRVFRDSPRARGKYAEKGHHAERYLHTTVETAIRNCRDIYDPNHGEEKKEKVRDTVLWHMDDLYSSDLRGKKRDVMLRMLDTAYGCGTYRNGWVEFNDNQQKTADDVGITQKYVSNLIKELMADGRLIRTSVGKPGKNSTYRLPRIAAAEEKDSGTGKSSPTYVDVGGDGGESSTMYVGDSSTTYLHRGGYITPVSTRSRTERSEGSTTQSVDALKTGPEIVAEFAESKDHTLGCSCALCSVQTPSYVTYPQGVTDLGEHRRSRERVA